MYSVNGIHKNNCDMLIHDKGEADFSLEIGLIKTYIVDREQGLNAINYYGYQMFKDDKGNYILVKDDIKIPFSIFDEVTHFSDPAMEYVLKAKRLKDKRSKTGTCHLDCLRMIDKVGDDIVTGYVTSDENKNRIIHSWIEDREYVYDVANNLIMTSYNYYRLLKACIIEVVTKDQVLEDLKSGIFDEYPIADKIYCLFRNELEYDIKKNMKK